MHTVNYKKYFYIAVFLLVTIIAYIVEVKYKFIRRMDADWISALATFVAVPVSIFSLAFQMKKENDDRRYDARTIFLLHGKKGFFMKERFGFTIIKMVLSLKKCGIVKIK